MKWQDLNLEERTAIIRRSLLQVGGSIYLQEDVKTKASKATIRLPGEVLKVLKQVKAQQARNKLLLGEAYQDNDLIFCKADGTAYRPDYIYHRFKGLLAENGHSARCC